MTTTISGTSGVTFPAGGVGNPAGAVVGTTDTQTLTNKTLTTPNINSAQVATVTGTAPLYMCRAWVNFNGQGTVAINASANVSSITDNGTGSYTTNFTTAMPDANFSAVMCARSEGINNGTCVDLADIAAGYVRFRCLSQNAGVTFDTNIFTVAVFR